MVDQGTNRRDFLTVGSAATAGLVASGTNRTVRGSEATQDKTAALANEYPRTRPGRRRTGGERN